MIQSFTPGYISRENKNPPGGAIVEILRFHRRGCGFDPWPGNYDPKQRMVQLKKVLIGPSELIFLLFLVYLCYAIVLFSIKQKCCKPSN